MMNLRFDIEPVADPATRAAQREAYLRGLAEAQVLLLEVMIPGATHYELRGRQTGEVFGYVAIAGGETVVEWHITREYWLYAETITAQILERLGPRRALVKSFDHLAMRCFLPVHQRITTRGLLGRDYVPRTLPQIDRVRFESRQATAADLPRIAQVDQDVFTHPERMRHSVEAGQVRLFEDGERLIGFGLILPIVPGRPEVEMGLAVDAPLRNRGHAVYMLRSLAEECLARGLTPVASSSVDNPASVRMGARVGFVPRYLLLDIEFPPRASDLAREDPATPQ